MSTDRVIPVQAVLTAAIDRGVLNPTETTARCAAAVGPEQPTRDGIDGDLLTAAEFVDDELWCAMTADELGLTELRFGRRPNNRLVVVELFVGGIDDPLRDVRVPRLLDAVRRYRRASGVALCALGRSAATRGRQAPDVGNDWRLIYSSGEPIGYVASRSHEFVDSVIGVTAEELGRLRDAGMSLDTIFYDESAGVRG